MAVLGAAVALTFVLAGCTGTDGSDGGGSSSGGTSSTGNETGNGGSPSATDAPDSSSEGEADAATNTSPLMPVFPEVLDAASAEAETVRVADEIEAQLDPSTILFVDDHPQVVDSTTEAGQYFGVLRILSLTESTDPVLLAKVLAVQLKAAGWTEASVDSTEGSYFVALISSDNAEESWILQLGGDTSAEGNGAITINLLSPTFP
jgi:hypothetical protein